MKNVSLGFLILFVFNSTYAYGNEGKISCYNRVLHCSNGGTPTCQDKSTSPLCLGNEISCCSNENGELTCDNFGEEVRSKQEIHCDKDIEAEKSAHAVIGDFNNDKKDDIAFNIPDSGNWTVASLDAENSFTNSTYGNWSIYLNWESVLAGDFDGDGFKDDIVGRNKSTNEIWLSISDGKKFKNMKSGCLSKGNWEYSSIGDFNADKKDDLIFIDSNSHNIVVGFSQDKSFENAILGKNTMKSTDFISINDFDGDGFNDDLILVNKVQKTITLHICENKQFQSFTYEVKEISKINKFYAVDFDKDGKTNLLGLSTLTGDWFSIALEEKPSMKNIGSWGNKEKIDEVLFGNFNSDKYLEILSRIKYDRFGWLLVSELKNNEYENIFYATPSIDLTGNMNIDHIWKWSPNVGLNNILVGDFNGDGKSDIAGKVPYYNTWFYLEVNNERGKIL